MTELVNGDDNAEGELEELWWRCGHFMSTFAGAYVTINFLILGRVLGTLSLPNRDPSISRGQAP